MMTGEEEFERIDHAIRQPDIWATMPQAVVCVVVMVLAIVMFWDEN